MNWPALLACSVVAMHFGCGSDQDPIEAVSLGPAADLAPRCSLGAAWEVVAPRDVEAEVEVEDGAITISARDLFDPVPGHEYEEHRWERVPRLNPILLLVQRQPLPQGFSVALRASGEGDGTLESVDWTAGIYGPVRHHSSMRLFVGNSGEDGMDVHAYLTKYDVPHMLQTLHLAKPLVPAAVEACFERMSGKLRVRAVVEQIESGKSIQAPTTSEVSNEWVDDFDDPETPLIPVIALAPVVPGEVVRMVLSEPNQSGDPSASTSLLATLLDGSPVSCRLQGEGE